MTCNGYYSRLAFISTFLFMGCFVFQEIKNENVYFDFILAEQIVICTEEN